MIAVLSQVTGIAAGVFFSFFITRMYANLIFQ